MKVLKNMFAIFDALQACSNRTDLILKQRQNKLNNYRILM